MKWTVKTADDFKFPFEGKGDMLKWARKNKLDLELDIYTGVATVYADNAFYLDGTRFITQTALKKSVPSGKTVVHLEDNNYALKDANVFVCDDKTFYSKDELQAWLRVTGNVTSCRLVKTEKVPGAFGLRPQIITTYTLGK